MIMREEMICKKLDGMEQIRYETLPIRGYAAEYCFLICEVKLSFHLASSDFSTIGPRDEPKTNQQTVLRCFGIPCYILAYSSYPTDASDAG